MQDSNYVWVITKSNVDSARHVGIIGPDNAPCGMDAGAIKRHPNAQKFRIKDGDGEIYFYGFFVDLSSENDDERPNSFEPLDDFGEAYGAVSIEYMNEQGRYVSL